MTQRFRGNGNKRHKCKPNGTKGCGRSFPKGTKARQSKWRASMIPRR